MYNIKQLPDKPIKQRPLLIMPYMMNFSCIIKVLLLSDSVSVVVVVVVDSIV